jgi:hypothetical protein
MRAIRKGRRNFSVDVGVSDCQPRVHDNGTHPLGVGAVGPIHQIVRLRLHLPLQPRPSRPGLVGMELKQNLETSSLPVLSSAHPRHRLRQWLPQLSTLG